MVNHDDSVRIGSWAEVRDGEAQEGWRIVPVEEADAGRGLISEASPLGRALLGHRAGDEVRVQAPGGRFPVVILTVEAPEAVTW